MVDPSRRPDLSLSQVQLDTAVEVDNAPTTPRTPADEGKEFFLSERSEGEQPIRVFELRLDPDGGPSKQRSASCPARSPECLLICGFTVYPPPPCLCALYLTRVFGCGDTCIEKRGIQNKLSTRWWLVRVGQVRGTKVSMRRRSVDTTNLYTKATH